MIVKRMLLVGVVLVGVCSEAWAAPMTHGWSKRFGDMNQQESRSVAVDGSGNVFVTGQFMGTVDFGGGALASAGGSDIFVAKYDAAGNHVWSKRFGDAMSQCANSVAVDKSENIVVTGYYYGSVNFGGSNLNSAGTEDIFVAKFDAAGNHLWSKRFGDANSQYAYGVAVDGSGNVAIAGQFFGTVDFGGGTLTSAGGDDIFVAKFDVGGNHLWSKRFGDANSQLAYGVAAGGSGNIALTGTFWSTVDFGGGTLTSAGNDDIFVVKFDANGNHLWSKRFGDASFSQNAWGIAADGSGNAVVTGSFWGTVNFGGGALTSAGLNDIFIAKFDTNGNHLWSKRCGDTSQQEGRGVAIDAWGNVIMTGHSSGTVDFGGGPVSSAGSYDVFVVKYNASGNHIWSKCFGDMYAQYGQCAVADGLGNVIATGYFDNTVNFGGATLTSTGGWDIFLAKFWRAAPVIHAVRDVPGDQGGFVNVAWDGSGCDTPVEHVITKYTVWRAIDPSLVSELVAGGMPLTTSPLDAGAWESGTPFIRVEHMGATTYYWYLIASVDAYYLPGYSAPVPTLFDWTTETQEYHYFQIIAHTSTPYVFYTSDPDSGYSVDNLAPAPPQGLAGEQSTAPSGLALTWRANHEEDLSHYAVYRGTTPGFVPGSGNLLETLPDTTLFDGGWRWDSGYYYKVSAFDTHGNEGGFAVLSPDGVTGIGGTPVPTASYLEQNTPNPFGAATRIAFGLKEASNVSLSVYDVSGRLVRVLMSGSKTAQCYEVVWDGRDEHNRPVASGVYFLSLKAGPFTQTRKMVVAR
jgi:hypothetical protein